MGVSVRHNARLAALVALAAAVTTVAWFSRALQTGSVADWFWCVVVASIGVLHLLVVRDSRAPLMVADDLGVRVRRGETWSGLRWQDIEHVEVQSPDSWFRDGQIVVHPSTGSGPDATEAYVVPLARTTKVHFDGLDGDLVSDLDALASGRVPVLVLARIEPNEPNEPNEPDQSGEALKADRLEKAELGRWTSKLARRWAEGSADEQVAAEPAAEAPSVEERPLEDAVAPDDPTQDEVAGDRRADEARDETQDEASPRSSETPGETTDEMQEEPDFEPVQPARAPNPAVRFEVVRDSVRRLPDPPAIPAQRTGDGPVVVARVDDFATTEPRPAAKALIGPLIAAARNRARLSIDTLSERTRIRPHVLECIEVDDFEACGGDFYARGHLRTLARIFGLDPQELVDLYDDHYAKAEIEARQVFEAELASGIGGGVRAAHTGPRWSLLAACVLALAGVWGVARVFNDTPQEIVSPAPNVVDSAGLAKAAPARAPKMTLAPLEVSAVGASPQVVVRDRDGRILWAGRLTQGQHQQVIGLAPFDVTASNGSAVKVTLLGKSKGFVAHSSAAGSRQFG